jgi:hypothetical protein
VKRSALAEFAGYGYGKSHHRYFWGLRLYVLAAPDGLPVAWCLATPKLGEREVVAAMGDQEGGRLRPGLVIVADKGFAGRAFEQLVTATGPCWCAPTGPMSHAGTDRWAAGASGSRAPSTPSRTSSAWNAIGAGPWPVSMSVSPNDCSR